MGPPPCNEISPGNLWGLCQFVVRLFRSLFAVLLGFCLFSGVGMMSDVALQDLTCVWIIVCVLSFVSHCLVCSPTPFLCFFFLPLRRWGNARPPGVCVSPCVSWTRPLTSTRTSRTTPTPRSPPRLCFSSSDDVVCRSGGARSWSVLCVLGLSFFLFLAVLVRCLNACMIYIDIRRRPR